MTIDSVRPILYRVTIDDSGLGGSAPEDGFIDAVIPEDYANAYILTGTQTNPTVNDDDTIKINEITVVFPNGSTDLTGIIAKINELTDQHHVVASNSSNKLQLTNENLYEGNVITVTGEVSVLTDLGYVDPVLSAIPGNFPSSLANGRAKARANARWRFVIEQLHRDTSPVFIQAVDQVGADVDTPPSEVQLTVAYDRSWQIYTYDEDNNNAIIEGEYAIRRAVARALTKSETRSLVVYDPTSNSGIVRGNRDELVEIGALAADLATAEANITVETIINVR